MHRTPGRWRAAVVAIGISSMLVPVVGASPAAAVSAANLYVTLGSTCVVAQKPLEVKLTVKLRRADGTVLDTKSNATANSSVALCFSKRVRAGHRLRLLWGGHVREVGVPDLTIAGNRVTDVVSGHGPASKHITVQYAACSLAGCGGYQELGRTVDGHGHWDKDLSSHIDLKGGDRFAVRYTNGSGDTFNTPERHAPYLQLSRPNKIHIECQPDRAVHLTLKSAGGTVRASTVLGKAGGCAAHNGTFRKNGAPVAISVGNIIRSDLASDAKVVWPHLAVSWTGTAVSARCLPSAQMVVRVIRLGSQVFLFSSVTGPSGQYDYPTTGFTSAAGDDLELTCATAKGDRIRYLDTVP